jgi:hypothetical protein
MYRVLRNVVIFILALGYIFIEYAVWDLIVKPFVTYVKKFKIYDTLFETTSYMNKYILLTVFLGLFVCSELLGLLALSWFAHGLLIPGVLMYIFKYAPAILAFAILDYNKEKLFSILWFKTIYDYVVIIINKLKQTKVLMYIITFSKTIKIQISKVFNTKEGKYSKMFSIVKNNIKL